MPRTRPYAHKHVYEYDTLQGVFELSTYTRSEARGLIKRKLGIPRKGRLPAGALVKRVG